MLPLIDRALRHNTTALQTHKGGRRRDFGAHLESRVQEVEHLRSQNGVVAADEDEHLAGGHDPLVNPMSGLFGGLQPEYFVPGHERPLDVFHESIEVAHDWRESLAAEIVGGFQHGGGAGHVADQFGGLELVGGEGDTDIAVRDDAFVVAVAELFDDVVEDYRDCERNSLDGLTSRLKIHLVPFLGEIRAADFTTQYIKRYVAQRRTEGAQNATINRELAIVRRAFRLGAKCDPPKVARIPYVQLLKESNVRTGFLEYECYVTVRNELPWYTRPLFVTAYHVGGRRGELTAIQWPQVDFNSNQIRLRASGTKNEEARTLPIYSEMREWLILAKEIRDQKFPNCSWVFYRDEGYRLYWFHKAWESACTRAGVPELLFHDLRRSAVRNMERAGIPRRVAMSISGHKTEHISADTTSWRIGTSRTPLLAWTSTSARSRRDSPKGQSQS
jgi:integrase